MDQLSLSAFHMQMLADNPAWLLMEESVHDCWTENRPSCINFDTWRRASKCCLDQFCSMEPSLSCRFACPSPLHDVLG